MLEGLFGFRGRMRRRDWWIAQLGSTAAAAIVLIVAAYAADATHARQSSPQRIAFGGLGVIVALGVIWINLATSAKRFHDQDLSAWFYLIGFVPVIGNFVLLGLLGFRDSREGQNRWGASQKYPADSAAVFD